MDTVHKSRLQSTSADIGGDRLPDHIRSRLEGRGIDGRMQAGAGRNRRGEDIEKEMFERHNEMNRHRVDEMLRRVEAAGFSGDEEAEVKKEIEEYFELEKTLLTKRFDDHRAAHRLHDGTSGADREAIMEKIRSHRDKARDSEKELREQVRDKRRDIESKIREKMRGSEFRN